MTLKIMFSGKAAAKKQPAFQQPSTSPIKLGTLAQLLLLVVKSPYY
jgi:hypothetical protein